MLRRIAPRVFPQMAKEEDLKFLIAQATKEIPMQRVFPLRIAPSQIKASYRRRRQGSHHQESAVICFLEKELNSKKRTTLIVRICGDI